MTDFIETFSDEDTALAVYGDGPAAPITLAAGDTLSGAIGAIFFGPFGPLVDQADGVLLATEVGQEYTITVSGYSDNNSYNFLLGDGNVIGTDPFIDGNTEFTHTFTATETETTFLFIGAGVLSQTNYVIAFDTVAFTPSEGDDVGVGTAEADVFDLLGGNDVFDAGDGYDNIRGGNGNDTINGEGGNDIIFGDDGADDLSGGDGKDSMRGGNDDDIMDGGAGADRMWGDDGNDIMSGGDGNDRMNGGLGDDDISGGNGNDKISAGAGDDTIDGGAGADIINGNNGNDEINAGSGNDAVRGGGGNDLILGGAGRDNLFGDSGADVLIGGVGNDKLTGGSGADIFVFETGHGADIVQDFNAEEDVLDFSGILIPLEVEPIDPGLDFPIFPEFGFEVYAEYATQDGANVVFTIDGGDSVTLLNTDLGDLSDANFVLPDIFFIPEILG